MTQPTAAAHGLQILENGNARYMEGVARRYDLVRRRAEISGGQHPHTTILSCSDSRVVPEYIFDAQPGELFVVRTAGQVADAVGLGSLEYGTGQLNTPLLLVMGHTGCGAVKATCESRGQLDGGHIAAIVKKIAPAAGRAEYTDLDQAILLNIQSVIEDIRSASISILSLEQEGRLSILGALYDLESGAVRFL